MSHLPKQHAVDHVVWGPIIRRGMVAAAALLALTSTAGCVVEAMYAVPVALDTAGCAIARVLPVDEQRYIVHSSRMPPGEPALAVAPRPAPAPANAARPATDLADAGNVAPQQPVKAPAETTPTAAVAAPVPMPVLMDSALARRTRT